MKIISTLASCLLLLVAASSCGGHGRESGEPVEGDTLTSHAELLTLVDCGDYVAAIVADPWNPGKTLASYALVQRDAGEAPVVPDGFQIVTVPLSRSVVDSSTNSAAIAQLGALGGVAAVSDGNYYAPGDTITKLIAAGRIADIGSSMSPKVETLVDVSPDAILSSPYKNAGHGVIETLKVPIIECADYMESTPLGRAEWILLLGHLYGNPDGAVAIFDKVCTDYNALCSLAAAAPGTKPKVLPEMLTSGVWYVPGGQSYMARMLADAGADYPWADDSSTGSLQLDLAAVLDRAADADIWFMRNYGMPTLASLRETTPPYAQIKAYADGNVYNCDTSTSPFFNDIAFHPERVLSDFITLFHPQLRPGVDLVYFSKVAQK